MLSFPESSTANECAHCSLPVGRRPVEVTVTGVRQRFCCYGCVLALQVTRARGDSGVATAIVIRLGLAIFFSMNLMMVGLPTYAPYIYGGGATTDGALFHVLRVLGLAFATPVIGLLGWPILASAWHGARRGVANTDALIVLGAIAAYVLSFANTVSGRGAVYFDTAAMLLVLVTLGRYLEARARAEAGAAVGATLAPNPLLATRLRHGMAETVAPHVLVADDLVRVAPGDAFPTDGVVLDGVGGVDEAALTGESSPVLKSVGSLVAGGSCSIDGLFVVRATAPAASSAAARIAALLARARHERAPAERFADRAASILVPVAVTIALAAGGYWTARAGIEQGVLAALAVLVVACPCGLGIATPVAVWTGLVAAARHGVIVRSGAALERAATVGTALFDKTGTLTERTPRLMRVDAVPSTGLSEADILGYAAALERDLTHPLALAIAGAWATRSGGSDPPITATDVRVLPGRGVRGVLHGEPTVIGSPGFAREQIGDFVRALCGTPSHPSGPEVLIWQSHRLLGALRFAEAPRPNAAPALAALRRMTVRIGLLTGDGQAAALVPALVDPQLAAVGLRPEDKLAHVQHHVRTSVGGAVAMIGDGLNDAPALAAADLGIAVGNATDLARLAADVAIINDDLGRVPWLIAYARRVARVIRQNLFWAFAYNIAAVGVAASGALNPLVASLAMLGSSLAVLANARRLRAL